MSEVSQDESSEQWEDDEAYDLNTIESLAEIERLETTAPRCSVNGCENFANTSSDLGVCNACARGETPTSSLRVKEREAEEARRRRDEEARVQWERDAMAWVAPITRERRNSKPVAPRQNSTSHAASHATANSSHTAETADGALRREREARRQHQRESTEPLLEPEIVVETLCAKEAADALLLGGEGAHEKLSLEARRDAHRAAVRELPVQSTCEEGADDEDEREEIYTHVADGTRAAESTFSPAIDCSFVRLSEARHARVLNNAPSSLHEAGLPDEATSAKLYGNTCARCGTRMVLVSRVFKTYAFLIDEDVFLCEDGKCGLRRKYVRVVDVLK